MTELAYVPEGMDPRFRQCKEGCGRWDNWRNMFSEKKTAYSEGAEQRAGTSQEIDDVNTGRQRSWWVHTCEACTRGTKNQFGASPMRHEAAA